MSSPTAISQCSKFSRFLVVVLCYLLSSLGLLALVFVIIKAIKHPELETWLVCGIWLYAWYCHLAMSYCWINQQAMKKFRVLSGTVAGITSFLLAPISGAISQQLPNYFPIADVCYMVIVEAAYILPCFLLAIYLVWFHLKLLAGRKQVIPAKTISD